MTDQPGFSIDGKRDSLRARIEAAERRNADRNLTDDARKAVSAAADYTRANPLTVIGGALVAGLVIGLLTRPGRRVALRVASSASEAVSGAASSATAGAKGIAARGGSRIGTMLGETAVAYVMALVDDALDTARAGQDRAGEFGDAANAQARKIRAGVADTVDNAAATSRNLARKTRSTAEQMVSDLKRKTKG